MVSTPGTSTILELGTHFVCDYSPPVMAFTCERSWGTYTNIHKHVSRKRRIVFLLTEASEQRISNLGMLVAGLEQTGVEILNPLAISGNKAIDEAYSDCELVISPHGSAMLNPLAFSQCKIVGLFPSALFGSSAHPNDIAQFSDIVLLFGSRIYPVFGSPEGACKERLGVNDAINMPHYYDMLEIQRGVEKAMTTDLLSNALQKP